MSILSGTRASAGHLSGRAAPRARSYQWCAWRTLLSRCSHCVHCYLLMCLRLSVGHSTAGQIRHNPTHWSEHLPDPVCPRNVCTHPSEITSRHENVADDFIPSRPTRLLPQPFSGVKLTLRVLGSYTSVSMTQPGPGQQSYSSSTYQSTARQWGPGGQCRGRLRGACIHGCNGADCKYFLPFVLSYDCTPCSWRSCNCKQAQASIGDC